MIHRSSSALALNVLVLLTFAATPRAQHPDHLDLTESIRGQAEHSLAYDSARERVVLFGRGGTWEWDGVFWNRRQPTNSPPGLSEAAMVYDEHRRCTVLFGGAGLGGERRETWEWNGRDWLQRLPATSPPARQQPGMTYDAARRRVVLFGGKNGSGPLSDTWEWDGTSWRQRFPAHSPPAAAQQVMAYDAARARTVWIGAPGAAGTWEWDGVDWSPVVPASRSPWVGDPAMTYDAARRRCVLFGDDGDGEYLHWEFDGTTWHQPRLATLPDQSKTEMVFDAARGEVLQIGGRFFYSYAVKEPVETWGFDGVTWRRRHIGTGREGGARTGAWDSRRGVLVSLGVSDPLTGGAGGVTREWDGERWSHLGGGPSYQGTALAYDATRGKTLLFGGGGWLSRIFVTIFLNHTWEWDGTQWTRRQPSTSPPARRDHTMAFDEGRARIVMFGGRTDGPPFGDTWEWNGIDWLQRAPASSPPPRWGHAMSHDPVRRQTLLHGGVDAAGVSLDDTWLWDGVAWQQVTSGGPPAAAEHAMAWDPSRQMVVLYAGTELWEFDGMIWSRVTTRLPLPPANGGVMAYAPRRQALIVTGGATTRLIGAPVQPETQTVGRGCPGSLGPLRLSSGLPRLGMQGLRVALDGALPSVPTLIALSAEQRTTLLGPDCALHLGLPNALFTTSSSRFGHAEAAVDIPFVLALRGAELYAQAAVLAPSSGPLGLALSPALRLLVGD